MSKALEAHLRLLAQLPKRTHEWQPTIQGWGQRRSVAAVDAIMLKLRDLEERKYSRKQMADACGCTTTTLRKYLGRVKC